MLRMVGRVLLHVLGFAPYIAISFGVVCLWRETYGFSLPITTSIEDFLLHSLQPSNVLLVLAVAGSWASWYVFCKMLMTVWWSVC